jgi:hypothetical protein
MMATRKELEPWKARAARIGWALAEAAIGAGVGLLVAILWLRGR